MGVAAEVPMVVVVAAPNVAGAVLEQAALEAVDSTAAAAVRTLVLRRDSPAAAAPTDQAASPAVRETFRHQQTAGSAQMAQLAAHSAAWAEAGVAKVRLRALVSVRRCRLVISVAVPLRQPQRAAQRMLTDVGIRLAAQTSAQV